MASLLSCTLVRTVALVATSLLPLSVAAQSFPSCDAVPECARLAVEARDLSKQGRHEDAKRTYEAAYQRCPDQKLLYNLARVLHKARRFDEAITIYQRYIDAGAEGSIEWRRKAEEHLEQARKEAAIELAGSRTHASVPDASIPPAAQASSKLRSPDSGELIAPKSISSMDDRQSAVVKETTPSTAPVKREYLYINVGLGTGGVAVSSGATAEVSWFYNRANSLYERSRSSNGGALWGGIGLRLEAGVFLWRGLSVGLAGHFQPYLNNNADSQENGTTGGAGCPDAAGRPSPCYATTSKSRYGYMILGKARYLFRTRFGNVFRPYVHLNIGGGEWRAAANIDGLRPQLNGQVDHGSPFQPTDVCSATYNGNMNNPMPPGCNSVASNPGYNLQDHSAGNVIPSNLNRVCPAAGPCIDTVQVGHALIGAGGGIYLGGKHFGGFAEFDLTVAASQQTGLLINVHAGPQFIW